LIFLGEVHIQGGVMSQWEMQHKYNPGNQSVGVEFSPHTVVDFKVQRPTDGSYPEPFNMMLVPSSIYPGGEYIPYFKEQITTIDFEKLGVEDFQIPGNYISFEDLCYHHKYTWDEFCNVVPIEEESIYVGDKLDTRGILKLKDNAQILFTNGNDEPTMCNGRLIYLTKI
jgi:hypothetical protein